MKEPTSVRIKDSFPIKKDFIEWSDALSVGVQEIDDQHKGLAAMVNEMSEGIKGGWGKEARDEVLTRLVEYTKVHFATEESLMSISNYPGISTHKKQHDQRKPGQGEPHRQAETRDNTAVEAAGV